MSCRVAVILNVGAGAQRPAAVEAVENALVGAGCTPRIRTGTGIQIATLTRAALHEGYTVIAAGGGDGTISTVASVLAGTRASLGVLPLGTLNHFAKDLHVPLDIHEAARTIASGQAIAVDVGEVNGRIFVNNSSVGTYPRLVAEREHLRRTVRSKWLALAPAVARAWFQYRWLRVGVYAGEALRVVRTPFVFVGNNEYQLEGMNAGARRSLTSGCLHVCTAPEMTRLELAWTIGGALLGRHGTTSGIESLLVGDCAIKADHRRLLVATDGELGRLETPLHYRIRPRALRVIVPAATNAGA